jgi:hypothetical protein
MSGLMMLLAVGWPGGHATGAPPDWTVVVSLIVTVLFMIGVYELAHASVRHRQPERSRARRLRIVPRHRRG